MSHGKSSKRKMYPIEMSQASEKDRDTELGW
jgi:hypothetical protein